MSTLLKIDKLKKPVKWLKESREKAFDKVLKSERRKTKDVRNHLPGRHDQKTHGRRVRAADAKTSLDYSKRKGGVTYQPLLETSPKEGMVLSIFPEHEEIIDPSELSEERIFQYMKKHRAKFRNKKIHFGGWHDKKNNEYALDLVVVVGSDEEATRLAKQHKQKAYYDLKKDEEIRLDQEEEESLAANCGWSSETDRNIRQGVARVRTRSVQKNETNVSCRYG